MNRNDRKLADITIRARRFKSMDLNKLSRDLRQAQGDREELEHQLALIGEEWTNAQRSYDWLVDLQDGDLESSDQSDLNAALNMIESIGDTLEILQKTGKRYLREVS